MLLVMVLLASIYLSLPISVRSIRIGAVYHLGTFLAMLYGVIPSQCA
jgi:hypothetical protein